jgi:hypothetical protein
MEHVIFLMTVTALNQIVMLLQKDITTNFIVKIIHTVLVW